MKIHTQLLMILAICLLFACGGEVQENDQSSESIIGTSEPPQPIPTKKEEVPEEENHPIVEEGASKANLEPVIAKMPYTSMLWTDPREADVRKGDRYLFCNKNNTGKIWTWNGEKWDDDTGGPDHKDGETVYDRQGKKDWIIENKIWRVLKVAEPES